MGAPAVSAGLGVASIALGLYGQSKADQAQREASAYNAEIARKNKIVAQRLALDARERGRIKEKEYRIDIRGLKGAQRVALAKSGVVVDQDTALDLLLDTSRFGEIGAENVRANAEREAQAHEARGEGLTAQAELDTRRSRSASSAARINMVSTILGGARDIYKDL